MKHSPVSSWGHCNGTTWTYNTHPMSKELQMQVGTAFIIPTPTFTLTHLSVKCAGNQTASWLKLVRLDACHQLRWLNRVLASAATSLLQSSATKPETNFTILVTTLFPNLSWVIGFHPCLVGSPGRPFSASTLFFPVNGSAVEGLPRNAGRSCGQLSP